MSDAINEHPSLLSTRTTCCLLIESSNRQVVNHFLNFLDIIFQAIVTFPQGVVLQVEETEARIQLVDKS